MIKKIYPLGGLGNQLFALAAAFVISGNSRDLVIIDGFLTQFGSNLTRHFELSEIHLPMSDIVVFENTKYSKKYFVREICRRKLRIPHPSFTNPQIDWNFNNPALSDLLKMKNQFASFSGQFQNFEIVQAAVEFGFPTKIHPVKSTYRFHNARSDLSISFHAIHIRGGDFKNQREVFPEIPLQYYKSAISECNELPIAIFSDDIRFVRQNYPTLISKASWIFGPSAQLSPVETMSLMSMAKVLTTANSTFSTWAGWFASRNFAEVNTVTPHHLDGWVDTLPSNWNRYNLF